MDHGNTELLNVQGVGVRLGRLVLEDDISRIPDIDPREDLYQGRFSGAVFSAIFIAEVVRL
jgi:hypothetical protein